MKKQDLTIRRGATFTFPVMWESDVLVYKDITGVTQSAPMTVTCVDHSIPDGWGAAIMSVKGMAEINAKGNPPEDEEFRPVTVVDPDHVAFNAVNAAGFKAYQSGGYLVYYAPQLLAGASARMQVRDKVGGNVLLDINSDDGGITIDAARGRVVIGLTAAVTAALTWRTGVYDLEVETADAVVTPLLYGGVTVSPEITT